MSACQRWRLRREAYRPAGEPFVPGRHEVVVLDQAVARPFVERHHYSGSYPAARLAVGLMRAGLGLAGVAVFSVPANDASIEARCAVPAREGVVLGRFVLLDEVEGNAETWLLARAFRVLERELAEVRAVLSYADPMPRIAPDGCSFIPGHVGTIYQAHNGRYLGRTREAWLWVAACGKVLSPRTLSKLRNDESGAAGAYEQLRKLGAPMRQRLEGGREYAERALREGPFRRVKHPGNHAYSWAVGRGSVRAAHGALPYPKAGMVLA